MPILEKIVRPEQARHWPDSIPLEYRYTAGVAGEEFLRELKENGKFLASKCPKCEEAYVPTRMYCPDCFVETKDRLIVDKPGHVYAYTIVTRDREGNKLSTPATVALIKFDGFKGGILHWLDTGRGQPKAGMKVEPVLRGAPKRKGSMADIVAFKQA